MVGHARYPALDPTAIASQSHAIVTDLLRGRLARARRDPVLRAQVALAAARVARLRRAIPSAAAR